MVINFAKQILDAPLGHTYIFATGQAGFIIKSKSGKLLAIDLYLSDCVERTEGRAFVRMLPHILSPEDLVFDVYVATHPHLDHFDVDSVPQIINNEKTILFCSCFCNQFVDSLGLDNSKMNYVKPGDRRQASDFDIEFISCDHGQGAPDAFGVIVNVDNKRIYEAGDTCLRTDFLGEVIKNGPIDVLIAPINGAFGNMNEEDCAVYANTIEPNITIPCHYGMFPGHGGNPGKFLEIMEQKYKNNNFIIMAQGSCYEVK